MNSLRYEDLPVIEGEKVVLRPITDSDTELIVRWRNDPEVIQYFLFREPFTAEMHRQWLEERVFRGNVIQYMILERSSMRPVGSVYLRDIDRHSECAEFGIFIGESGATSRGLGTETAELFNDFAFNVLKLHRVYAKLIKGNVRSLGMFMKNGFTQEGVFRDMVKIDGEYKDIVFVSRLAGEGAGE